MLALMYCLVMYSCLLRGVLEIQISNLELSESMFFKQHRWCSTGAGLLVVFWPGLMPSSMEPDMNCATTLDTRSHTGMASVLLA